MSFFDDELDEADLKFLQQWDKMAKSDTADSEYNPETKVFDGEGGDEEGNGEIDPDTEGDEESDAEGDQIDESKMDLSDVENGDSDSTHGDSEGEDAPELEGDDRLSDFSEAEDDELDFSDDDDDVDDLSDEAEDRDQLKGGDTDSDIPEGESDLDYDPLDDDDLLDSTTDDLDHEHGKAEDEFEGDERANTDEEIEDLDDYINERDERQDKSVDELEDSSETDDADDEGDDDSGADESSVSDEGAGTAEGDDVGETPPHEDEDESTPEVNPSQSQNNLDDSGLFGDLPVPDERCENHCEDNLPEDEDHEECEHCNARLEKERELWGVVAQDKNGKDLLPGDKIRVVVPMPFTVLNQILTVNVPNMEIDPKRVAQSTAGEINSEACWLSGAAISNFTGWHLNHNGAIWTFKKGKKLLFAEKIGEPEFQRHGSNDLDGDQLDTEDLIEKFKQELDEGIPEADEEEVEEESDDGPESDEEAPEDDQIFEHDDDDTEDEEEDEESEEEKHKRRHSDHLTGVQKARFESLTKRIIKKIEGTFGNTLESIEVNDISDRGSFVDFTAKIISRGTVFGFSMTMRKVDLELDGEA